MSELSFAQPERRNFLVPLLIALVVVGGIFAWVYLRPHRIADISISHVAVVPEHTVFESLSKVVGHQSEAQDDLYVLTTVHIVNRLKIPLTIDDISGTLNGSDESVDPVTTTAVQKGDLDNLYITFPSLKPLAGPPLTRDTAIQPGEQADGMVLLHFPVAQADWDKRKSATVTINFYKQEPFTLTIPNP